MVEYFNDSQHTFWFVIGFFLLAIEGLVLGMTTGVVLFSGIGALITGALMYFGLIPATWTFGIAAFAICSVVITALLWKPLKMLQTDTDNHKDKSSDFLGHEFRLETDVSLSSPGTTRYSGVEWRVEIDDDSKLESISAGAKVKVTDIDAGVFRVVKAV